MILSKLSYCIEATSSCPKSVLNAPIKGLNRCVRTVTEEWDRKETKNCFTALKWLTLKEMAVFRIYKLARKMISRGDPVRILSRFADLEESGAWKVKNYDGCYRTAVGKRMFSSRIKRLWSVLGDSEEGI